jgi:hypothetical protein
MSLNDNFSNPGPDYDNDNAPERVAWAILVSVSYQMSLIDSLLSSPSPGRLAVSNRGHG